MNEAELQPYVHSGLLSRRSSGGYNIYCYTKDTFFTKTWDDITRACRGLVFRDGKQINHPFPKIFNLDEVEDTDRQRVNDLLNSGEHCEIMHKVNGHLTILTWDAEKKKILVSTKGSLASEMVDKDQDIIGGQYLTGLKAWLSDYFEECNVTLMFESITPSDAHTLYAKEVERYGSEECMVLLGGYEQQPSGSSELLWTNISRDELEELSKRIGCPVAEFFDDKSLCFHDMFNEKDTEGYVLWFPELDFRVKIKTKDYWRMRFAKDLSAEQVLQRFSAAGSDRVMNRYPEEIAEPATRVIAELMADYLLHVVYRHKGRLALDEVIKMDDKVIAQSPYLTKLEKSIVFNYKKGFDMCVFMRSKMARKQFVDYALYDEGYKAKVTSTLVEYIENNLK